MYIEYVLKSMYLKYSLIILYTTYLYSIFYIIYKQSDYFKSEMYHPSKFWFNCITLK